MPPAHRGLLGHARARKAADLAIKEVRRIEKKYSRYETDSIVSRISASAGTGQAVEVDPETADLLDFVSQLYLDSDGLFDITTGVLRHVWDFRNGLVCPPRRACARRCLRVGWQRVRWQRPFVELPLPGMELDFGGFGKEYAADPRRHAAGRLRRDQRAGQTWGGDIRVVGPAARWPAVAAGHRAPAPRRRGDRKPLNSPQAVSATSGDYERYFEIDGQRLLPTSLDPRSGFPVDHWQSVSVVAPACLAAGALTTIAMLKRDKALDFLRAQGVRFLTVDAHGLLSQVAPDGHLLSSRPIQTSLSQVTAGAGWMRA